MKNFNQTKEEIILISEETDRNYWTTRLGVTAETLKSAIRATKSITLHHITAYLNQQNSSQFA
ncbi:hypothetical protein DHW03_06530 [Pedobacter yonginense]|uniref:DUF3606 domain-containing protein n=1 Tax=Pedobacter yonginense TaxID=651869 RepID=A0A317ESS7_9SPHI|nr:DUF3606 domain-containing protein [Pedobacter yonginense]PWS29465.1 hypothetical protein DHW03_06530 [Pedobacter yonginense]